MVIITGTEVEHQHVRQPVLRHQHVNQVQTIPPNPSLHQRLQQEHPVPEAAEVQVIVVVEAPEAVEVIVVVDQEVAEAVEAEDDNYPFRS